MSQVGQASSVAAVAATLGLTESQVRVLTDPDSGEEFVVLSRADYDDLRDRLETLDVLVSNPRVLADIAEAKADVEAGRVVDGAAKLAELRAARAAASAQD